MNKANNKWAFNNLCNQVMYGPIYLLDKNIRNSKILVRNFFIRYTRNVTKTWIFHEIWGKNPLKFSTFSAFILLQKIKTFWFFKTWIWKVKFFVCLVYYVINLAWWLLCLILFSWATHVQSFKHWFSSVMISWFLCA